MARKGQFKKGGGRVGTSRKSHSRKQSKAMVHTRTRTRTVHVKAKRRRHGGGGMQIVPLIIAAAGVGYLAGDNSPIKQIPSNLAKLPGAKTFGNPAMLGVACLAIDRFAKRNKWLRLAGYAGIAAAALGVGAKGTAFKWLGDDDVGYDDDMGDDEMGDDEMGDDEMGDDDVGDDDE